MTTSRPWPATGGRCRTLRPESDPNFATVLQIDDVAGYRGRWLRLDYDGDLGRRPCRPLLRYHRSGKRVVETVLPAPLLGQASWTGLAPRDLSRIEVLATAPDAFQLRSLRTVSRFGTIVRLAFRWHVAAALLEALPTGVRGARARVNAVRSLLHLRPLTEVGSWIAARTRIVDAGGVDDPTHSMAAPRSICVVVSVAEGQESEVDRTLQAVDRQVDQNVRALVVCDDDVARTRLERHLSKNGRAVVIARSDLAEIMRGNPAGWFLPLSAGDVIPPWVVLSFRAEIARTPELRLLYADSARLTDDGRIVDPAFRPGWSPEWLRRQDYIGHSFAAAGDLAVTLFTEPDPTVRRVADDLSSDEVVHVPRIAFHQRSPRHETRPTGPRPPPGPGSGRSVAIVMPTRDRLDLLRVAVSSLLAGTDGSNWRLVIADNGSTEPETHAFLAAISSDARVRVVPVPGDFNFSRIVNRAVTQTDADVIVLLNNDVEIEDPAWLQTLTGLLQSDDVGAVGAKLLYPDRRLQHAGVVVGWGNYAGHFGRLLPADAPGHLGRRLATHEVSAVTAACLAVRRDRFLEVGGFSEDLAVAFNDVDFCLKLRARGYRNLWTPDAVLIHHESASRGEDRGPRRERFRGERALFASRWRHVIQDDPYFHPAWALTKNVELLE